MPEILQEIPICLGVIAAYHAVFLRVCFKTGRRHYSIWAYAVSVYTAFIFVVTGFIGEAAAAGASAIVFAVALLRSRKYVLIPFFLLNLYVYVPYGRSIGFLQEKYANVFPLFTGEYGVESDELLLRLFDFLLPVAVHYLLFLWFFGYFCFFMKKKLLPISCLTSFFKKKDTYAIDDLAEMNLGYIPKLRLRSAIHDTDYGRLAGWYVEEKGRRLALLSDPAYVEMFWVSYSITPLSDDPLEREAVMTDAFWLERDVVYRSKRFDIRIDHAFSALTPLSGGRVIMRGLYLVVEPPSFPERILLRFLRQ